MSTLTHPVVLMTLISAFVWFGFDVIGPWLLRSTVTHIATQTKCAAPALDPYRPEVILSGLGEWHFWDARVQAWAPVPKDQLYRISCDRVGAHLEPAP